MEDRWEKVQILPYKKYVKTVTAGNHSILALSKVNQPAAVSYHDKLLRLFIFNGSTARPADMPPPAQQNPSGLPHPMHEDQNRPTTAC